MLLKTAQDTSPTADDGVEEQAPQLQAVAAEDIRSGPIAAQGAVPQEQTTVIGTGGLGFVEGIQNRPSRQSAAGEHALSYTVAVEVSFLFTKDVLLLLLLILQGKQSNDSNLVQRWPPTLKFPAVPGKMLRTTTSQHPLSAAASLPVAKHPIGHRRGNELHRQCKVTTVC